MQQEVRDSCTDIFTGIHLHHNNLDQAAALDRLAGARLMLGAHTHTDSAVDKYTYMYMYMYNIHTELQSDISGSAVTILIFFFLYLSVLSPAVL